MVGERHVFQRELGAWLKAMRGDRGQETVAAAVGHQQPWLSRIEGGKGGDLTVFDLLELADELGLDDDQFVQIRGLEGAPRRAR